MATPTALALFEVAQKDTRDCNQGKQRGRHDAASAVFVDLGRHSGIWTCSIVRLILWWRVVASGFSVGAGDFDTSMVRSPAIPFNPACRDRIKR
jgi:hypothetical protein